MLLGVRVATFLSLVPGEATAGGGEEQRGGPGGDQPAQGIPPAAGKSLQTGENAPTTEKANERFVRIRYESNQHFTSLGSHMICTYISKRGGDQLDCIRFRCTQTSVVHVAPTNGRFSARQAKRLTQRGGVLFSFVRAQSKTL